MAKTRGFSLRHRVFRVFRFFRFFRRNRSAAGYIRLDPATRCWRAKAASGLVKVSSFLKAKAKELCPSRSLVTGRGYMQVGHAPDLFGEKPVPKGQMAVYVGQKNGGDFQRVLVPVIYCNHPLFGQLLREAENEFGYNHPGAITIPCRISEFEHIQTRIKQGRSPRGLLTWRRNEQLKA